MWGNWNPLELCNFLRYNTSFALHFEPRRQSRRQVGGAWQNLLLWKMILNRIFHYYFSGEIALFILSDSCLSQPGLQKKNKSEQTEPQGSLAAVSFAEARCVVSFLGGLFQDFGCNCKRRAQRQGQRMAGRRAVSRGIWSKLKIQNNEETNEPRLSHCLLAQKLRDY